MKNIRNALLPVLAVLSVLATACATPLSENTKTVVGTWTHETTSGARTYVETLVFESSGTYSIEAVWTDTGAVIASQHGTFTFTGSEVVYTDSNAQTITETYVFGDEQRNELVLTGSNGVSKSWTRT